MSADRELDVRCARALGWVDLEVYPHGAALGKPRADYKHACAVPEFTNHRIHAQLLIEDIDRRAQRKDFVSALAAEVEVSRHFWVDPEPSDIWAIVTASPSQIVRAYLEAVEG